MTAADLWPLVALLAVGAVVVACIAYHLGQQAQARRQRLSRRHPLTGSRVIVHRPANAPEARLALAAANEASSSAGPVYDQEADL